MYTNKNDPRVFAYLDDTYKWCGVTLNFAHKKSWIVMMLILLPVVANVICVAFIAEPGLVLRRWLIFFAAYFPVLVTTCFIGASRDLKRHPGPQGQRAG
jgi:hypothetical protein